MNKIINENLKFVAFKYDCGSVYRISKNEFNKIFILNEKNNHTQTIFDLLNVKYYIEIYVNICINKEGPNTQLTEIIFYYNDSNKLYMTKKKFYEIFIESEEYLAIRAKGYEIEPVLQYKIKEKLFIFSKEGLINADKDWY